ncbi:hypothetical protein [Shewanella sp.]|uniref:hypothetical protein n=1 Tax=Shewanella sp. TaxID=50422 RepID=UPI003F3A8B61
MDSETLCEQVKAVARYAIAEYHSEIYSELEHLSIARRAQVYRAARDKILRELHVKTFFAD